MFYIFVDTQAFERAAFGFNHATSLVALVNAVADGHVTVLMTEVTDREVKDHIVDRVTKALAAIKKEYVLQVLTVVDFDQWRTLDAAAATKNALDQWEEYKRDISPDIVSIDLAKPTAVMEAFFALKPPFSAKKRSEFRDAFVLEALRAWAEREDQQVLVVSGDSDHRNACDGVRLVHAETIDDALARTLNDEDLLEAAKALLRQQSDVLIDRLQDELAELPLTVEDDYDADVAAVEVSNIRLDPEEFELVEVRNSTALLTGTVTVRVQVQATVADYDNGSRDEGDWVFLPYNEVTYSTDVATRVSVRITFEDGPPLELAGVDSASVEEPRELRIGGRWEMEMRRHWSEDE